MFRWAKDSFFFRAMAVVCAFALLGCNSEAEPIVEVEEMPMEEVLVPEDEPVFQPKEESSYFGPLQVVGSQLCDQDENPVQLRGMSSHGLSWFPEYVNEDMIRQLKEDWGCNVFRVAMYTAEDDGYCVGDDANQQALKERIDVAVQATKELDMYVVIDWHTLSDNNPQMYQVEAVAFFDELAAKYADEEHVIYEICNEPNGGTTWQDVKDYADEVIPVIRQHTDAVILVGTPNWCKQLDRAVASPIENVDNLMYTLHFYAATYKQELRDVMVEAVKSGLPVFVSEFGICDASGNGTIDEQEADLWLQAMNDHQISFCMWNLSNKDESSATIQNSCTKTSGLDLEDLSQAGVWFVSRMGSGD